MPNKLSPVLRDVLIMISSEYDRHHVLQYDQPAQQLLQECDQILEEYAPLGFKIGASGQKPFPLTNTPWIGFLDLDESTTFQEGIYVVYLFTEDLKQIYLSLNQGTEKLKKKLKMATSEQLNYLRATAESIRTEFKNSEIGGLESKIDLKSNGQRQVAYMAGNIVAIRYDIEALPDASVINEDLGRFLNLYRRALQIRSNLVIKGSIENFGIEVDQNKVELSDLGGFNPKDDADYVATIAAKTMVKSRRHETLVKKFGVHAQKRQFLCATPHPIDILLSRNEKRWIVEAKVVYNLNFAEAVRSAVGQLFEYQYFLQKEAELIALFDQPINKAYVDLLLRLGISVIWNHDGSWNAHSSNESVLSLASKPLLPADH